MNLRFEALSAVSRNPGAPLDELVDMLSVSGKPARQAVLDAKKGGLLSLMRDDVTGKPGYVLTDAGKKRLAAGPERQAGSSMVKGVQPAHLKKAAEKAQPKAEPVAPAPEHDDINAAGLMPPADPAVLASANRMLSDRLAGVAHALRGSGLEGLKDLDDGADLQPAVAALTGAYQMALARIADLEIVSAKLDDLQQDVVDVADLDSGYLVVASKRKPRRYKSEDKAREAAESAIRAGAQRAEVFPLAPPIGRAIKGAVWRAARVSPRGKPRI